MRLRIQKWIWPLALLLLLLLLLGNDAAADVALTIMALEGLFPIIIFAVPSQPLHEPLK